MNTTDIAAPSTTVQTFLGVKFDPLHPDIRDINIIDIAHGLSQLCRFNGQTKTFYSVAQHSVIVASHVRPEHRKHALLHDASEAYLTDLPTPLKRLPEFKPYRDAEAYLQRLIYTAFGLDPIEPEEIAIVDKRVFVTEARDLMREPIRYMDLYPYRARINPLPPEAAKALFLDCWHQLELETTNER